MVECKVIMPGKSLDLRWTNVGISQLNSFSNSAQGDKLATRTEHCFAINFGTQISALC